MELFICRDDRHKALSQVITLLMQHIAVASIYCFGERIRTYQQNSILVDTNNQNLVHYHFDLLVLTTQTGSVGTADLSFLIHQTTMGRCSVTLLLHQVAHLYRIAPKQHLFFYRVILESEAVFTAAAQAPVVLQFSKPKRDVAYLKRFWFRRHTMALVFMEAASGIENPNGDPVLVSLFHQAAEHLCLGLIAVFLGYYPHCFHLGYLFDLCDHFSPVPASIFPRTTEEEQRLFGLLAANHSQLRDVKPLPLELADVEVLQIRIRRLYREALVLADIFLKVE